jgi:hypothetical protein
VSIGLAQKVRYPIEVKPAVLGALGGAAFVACVAGAFVAGRAGGADGPASRVDVRSTPGVVTAIRDVAKLEATSFHIEKVVEARDGQSRLWGLLQPEDALLLVAVGDVVAGVDLTKLREGDVSTDESARTLRIRLPAPEVTSSTLDERATHVYSRSTDILAERNEQLEGAARRQAEEQMRKLAIDSGILERARASADRTLRALLRSLGYAQVDIAWADRASQ